MFVSEVLKNGVRVCREPELGSEALRGADQCAGHELGVVDQAPSVDRLEHDLLLVGGVVDRGQTVDRVGDLGTNRDEDRRDLVAPGLRCGAPNRHRRHRHEWFTGQLALVHQVATQRAAHDGQERVVDRRARHRLFRLAKSCELEPPTVVHAMGCDGIVEPGVRHRRTRGRNERQRRQLLRRDRRGRKRAPDRLGVAHRHRRVVQVRPPEQFPFRRRRLRAPLLGRRERLHLGVRTVHRVVELGTRLAVHRCMVRLVEDRERSRRDAVDVVEAFDHVELPRRAAQVERSRHDAGDLDAELSPVARLGEREVSHVELEVELAVVDPVRMIQVHRHADDPGPEVSRKRETRLVGREDLLEADDPVRRGGRVVDVEPGAHRRCRRRLAVEEGSILGAQLLHRSPSSVLVCGE